MKLRIPLLIIGPAMLLFVVVEGLMMVKINKCLIQIFDKKSVTNMSCWVKVHNRSTKVLNLNGYISRPINRVSINGQLYKMAEINYRPFLVNVTENFCEYFTKNRAGWYLRLVAPVILPFTNLNHPCPFFGHLEIKNMAVSGLNLPLMWPDGSYRLDVLILEYKPLFNVQVYVEFKERH